MTTTDEIESCDVLVIGGGPAGSTAATLLARQGRRVVLVDKARHPRFHIGESLLPGTVRLLEELGVRSQVEAIGMPKYGIEFISPEHDHTSLLEFADAWDKGMPMAWQVRRSAFDELLFRHAAAQGAQAIEGCRVRDVAFDAEGATVQATLDDGAKRTWRARFIVDATGRDTFLANKLDAKRKNPAHNSAALFGHFTGARRLQGKQEGYISIFWFQHGWFWFIPLADGSTSVGAVCWPYYLKSRDKPLKEFFADTIAMAPRLEERLRDATLIDDAVYATGNYSYKVTHGCGDRYVMIGDAFAFIDPVFSSGVHLAISSAFAGADLVAAHLDQPAQVPAMRRRFEATIETGPREFSWFIYRMTNPAIRRLFMYPKNPLRMKEALLSLLAGDVYGRSPIRFSLNAFKVLYYLNMVAIWRSSWAAWKARRRYIAEAGPVKGENILVDG